jgi:hypothetical protein
MLQAEAISPPRTPRKTAYFLKDEKKKNHPKEKVSVYLCLDTCQNK